MPNDKTNSPVFEVDERLCPLEAVQNAAYTFTDRAYVRVEPAGEGKLRVTMDLKDRAAADARALRGEFDNELLHQALRLRVSETNQKIREFIVTKALVSAQPAQVVDEALKAAGGPADCPDCRAQTSAPAAEAPAAAAPMDEALEKEIDRLLLEIEKGGSESDPLGVNVPWEEKFAPKDGAEAEAKAAPKAKGKTKRKKA